MFNKFFFYDMNDQLHSMSCGSSDMTTIDIRQEEGMVELMRQNLKQSILGTKPITKSIKGGHC